MAKFSDGTEVDLKSLSLTEIGKELYTTFLENNVLSVFLPQEEVNALRTKYGVSMSGFLSQLFMEAVKNNGDNRIKEDFVFELKQALDGWSFSVKEK